MSPKPSSSRKAIRPNLLDSLAILLVSGALVLLIFWIVFQMFNLGERFGTLPPWVEALVGKTWSWATAGAGGGVLLYWFRRRTKPGVPTPDYLRWILSVSAGLLATVMVVAVFVVLVVKPTSPSEDNLNPGRFQVDFSFKIADNSTPLAIDQLAMKPTRPNLLPLRYIIRQANGHFIESIDAPKPNDTFYAYLRRKPIDSYKQFGSAASELCFQRASPDAKVSQATVNFDCEEGRACTISKDNPSWAKPCLPDSVSWFRWPSLARFAWAQPAKPKQQLFWVVPSLQSLQESGRSAGVGYTKFSVKSTKVQQLQANVLRYDISVNRTPVRIDGFSPDELALPYNPEKEIQIDFGLQNLDFRGADGGHDIVELKIELLKGREPVRRYDVKLCYVALRSAPAQTVELSDQTQFEWKATYHQAKNEREYEVFIYSTSNSKDAEARRSRLSKLGWTYTDGTRIHGVTRPSLGDNPNYGVAVGLEQSSGQIRFTYDQARARQLLNWVKSKRTESGGGVVAQDSYLYRIGTREQVQQPCRVEN
jgi:hypothetical protein